MVRTGPRSHPLRSHPPAWYPDPYQPGQLRRWNGRSWTDEIRSIPPWLRGITLAPGPEPRRWWRNRNLLARRLWAASTLTLVMALLVLLSLLSALRPADTGGDRVADGEFLAAASTACGSGKDAIDEVKGDPEEVAVAVERLVVDLQAIPVAAAERSAVERWLAEWDAWTEAGHAYAQARAAGDQEAAARANNAGLAARAAVNRFAYANGLTACVM